MRATSQLVHLVLLLLLLLLICFFLLSIQTSDAAGLADKLEKGQNLTDGETLVSARGSFTLGFFSPGSSTKRYLGMWFSVSNGTVCWVANRDHPLGDTSGMLVFSDMGSLVLLDGARRTAWSSDLSGAGSAAVARLLESGNLVVRDGSSNAYLWQSFDHPSDTLLPGMKLGKNLWTGAEWCLTCWRSADDPSPGDYRRKLDTDGLPEVVTWHRDAKKFRTGPWNGLYFNGVPKAKTDSDMYPLQAMTTSPGEITYANTATAGGPLSRVVMNHTGVVEWLVWDANSRAWTAFFRGPRDPCDAYAKCGAFGLCNANAASLCSCAKGFSPASPPAWSMGETSGGCRRDAALDCGDGTTTDGFALVRGVKLPDTHNASVDMRVGLEECKARCFANCSCLAYAAADIRGGGDGTGCIIWADAIVDLRFIDSGQNLYLRLSKFEFDIGKCQSADVYPCLHGTCVNMRCSAKKSIRQLLGLITIIAISAGFGLLFAILGVAKITNKLKQRRAKKLRQKYFKKNHGLLLQQLISSNKDIAEKMKIFSLEELEQSTNKFDQNRILGGGGHSTVYKGILSDQRVVAIKKAKIIVQREINQFINEVVILSQTNHRNVVKLFGCCLETEVPLLVYEFISNGTLSYHLHGQSENPLSWKDRLRIALEIARAIAYLHSAASISVYHRDIKCANILLTDTLTAKVSDFGASRSIAIDETGTLTAVQGTHGYLDPEYYYTSRLTEKSDVYSFGVILAELLTRVRPVFSSHSSEGTSLASYFVSQIRDNRLSDILDSQIVEEGGAEDAQVVAKLAETCLSLKGEERPTARQVEIALEDVQSTKLHHSSQITRVCQNALKDRSYKENKGGEGTRLYSLEKEFIQSSEIPR